MKNLLVAAIAIAAAALPAAPAMALNAKSFVSGHGSDGNACTFAAPCLTLNYAVKQTSAGGEIDVLDSADYGPVTIDKAITIVNDGAGTASILAAPGHNGITINASTTDAVSLRGLTIDGGGAGIQGIRFNSGQSLTVENCAIRHFKVNGIMFAPTGDTRSAFSLSNTTVSNNTNDGVAVAPTGQAVVMGMLSRVTASNNGTGVEVLGSSTTGQFLNVTFSDSVATNNTSGLIAHSGTGHPTAMILVRNSVISDNSYGVYTYSNGVARLDHSGITGNFYGVNTTSGGTIYTYGNNSIDGDNQEAATLTPIPLH